MELKVGDKVLVTYRNFGGPMYVKTTIERKTPTGQLVIAHKRKTRFRQEGNYYRCMTGDNAFIEQFDQEKWDTLMEELQHKELGRSIKNKMTAFTETATMEQLRQIEAIMNENFISKKGVR